MKSLHRYLILPVALLAFGCKGNDSKKVDDALNSDLSLASQAQPYTAADSISAAERANALTSTAPAPAAPVVTHKTVVHHVYERSGGSSGSAGSSSGSYSRGTVARSGPIDHVEKHPGRDAAIGAAAGAVLGATTSRNKVKGGIIGAAAGGILGAVIGNNVDKRKVPNP
jgi:hypothetical protein